MTGKPEGADHAGGTYGSAEAATGWRRSAAARAQLLAPLTERMLDLAQVDIGHRVLDVAAGNGNAECVAALLAAGVDINQRYANEATALMWAAAYGKNDSVKLLLERGADVSARDNRGESALSLALSEKHPDTAQLLRAAGAKQ